MVAESFRVLKASGTLICVSHSGAEDRLGYFPDASWRLLHHEELPKQKTVTHVYVFQKRL